MVFALPLMEFPFLFLNLNENGILPIFSHDCGANLTFIFESFLKGGNEGETVLSQRTDASPEGEGL